MRFWGRKKDEPRIDFIKEMQILELKPGDVIVLKMKNRIPEKSWPLLQENFRKATGAGNKIVILEDEMDMGILRPQ